MFVRHHKESLHQFTDRAISTIFIANSKINKLKKKLRADAEKADKTIKELQKKIIELERQLADKNTCHCCNEKKEDVKHEEDAQ